MSEIQNMSTTPQNPNEVKDLPLPTPISIQHLKTALSGHPDQNFVSQFCNNFKFGVHIGFRGNGPQGFQGNCQRLSLTQILFLQIFLLFLQTSIVSSTHPNFNTVSSNLVKKPNKKQTKKNPQQNQNK